MEITFFKDKTWNIPQIPQYQGYEYSPLLCCPECANKLSYDWKKDNKHDIIGYCEVNGELQICCECHICGHKYRYHFSKYYKEDCSFDIDRWKEDIALQLYLNNNIYKKFEITTDIS